MITTKPYIIAEIASAHEGDPALCRRMIALAAATGADAVKLQIFNRDGLISLFHPKYGSFGEIEMSPQEWRELLAYTLTLSCDVVVEPFDLLSLDLVQSIGGIAAYKLPTSDIGNSAFLTAIGKMGKPVMLGVGGARHAEIARALEIVQGQGCPQVILLHGFQAYPTRLEDSNLVRISSLATRFACQVGYADHIDAEDAEAVWTIPAMALGAGAQVIEKHFTDARCRQGRDRYSALNPDEFSRFVVFIRRMAQALGNSDDVLSDAEQTYRQQMKRHAVLVRGLPAGTVLAAEHVTYKRTNQSGLGEEAVANLLGRPLLRDMVSDQPLMMEDLQ